MLGSIVKEIAAKTIGNHVFSSLNISGVRKCKYWGRYKSQSYLSFFLSVDTESIKFRSSSQEWWVAKF